jgi:hypothetical protein
MKNIVIAAVSALLFSCPALAQQTLLGKYSGTFSYIDHRGEVHTGISLEILSVDGDSVSAKAVRASGSLRGRSACAGEYQLEGKVKGDALELRVTEKGGGAGDCGMTLRLTVDGNKLVGTVNKNKAQLSK